MLDHQETTAGTDREVPLVYQERLASRERMVRKENREK